MESNLLTVHPSAPADKGPLIQRARMLAWIGIAWHVAEVMISIAAGLAASSIALICFGVNTLIASAGGVTGVWRFATSRQGDEQAERRAQRLIGASFVLIGVY